jgi:hypothetical protein
MNDFEGTATRLQGGVPVIRQTAMLLPDDAWDQIARAMIPAMPHGWVARAWLVKQYAKWLDEMEEKGTLEICGEEKKKAHGH